ncbi:MAG: hypothetical protein ABWX65_13085 [Mycetocola sp.]
MDLGDVLVDLYLRAPAEFVATRTQRATTARAEDDVDGAKQISRLPKPSAAAWLMNLLAARKTVEIDELVALGAQMREAEKDLDAADLRRLGKQRLTLIRSIARLGHDLAVEAGHRMSPAALTDLEQTLQAGMADAAAADAIRSGRLVRALTSNGIDPVDLDGAVAMPSVLVKRSTRPALRPVEDAASVRRLADATERAERARSAASAAQKARSDLGERRTAVSERRRVLRADREELTARLADIDREIAGVDREDDAIRRAAASADKDAEVAARAVERAEQRLSDLKKSP